MHGSKAVDDNVGEIHTLADATITAAKPNMGNNFIPFHEQKSYFTSLLLLLENVSRFHASTTVRVRHETTTLLVEYHQGFMNGHFVGESEIIVFSQGQIYCLKLMEA
jgi:hypothetical protein